jgi:hypothetical protein
MSDARFPIDPGSQGFEDESLKDLEAKLFAARDYVRPSDRLRARVIDNATQWMRDRTSDRMLYRTAMVMCMCMTIAFLTVRKLEHWWDSNPSVVSSLRMQENADRLARERGLAPQESLADAYSEWRASLAAKWWLGQP